MKKRFLGKVVALAALVGAFVFTAAGCSSPVERLWAYPVGSALYSTPLVTSEFVIFGSEGGTLYAVDNKGQSRWQYQVPSGEIYSRPATDGKLIFFGSTNQKFYALDQSGTLRWQFAAKERIKSDPVVADGIVYTSSYDGHVYALRAGSGKLVWKFPPEPEEEKSEEKAPGESKEQKPAQKAPEPKPGAFSYSAPAISGGTLYVGNLDGYLYALDAASGALKWRFKAGEGITSSPLVESGVVYFGSKDDHVYAVDAGTGKLLWKFKTGDDVLSSARISEGVLYIGSNDKKLYGLDPKTGKEKCSFLAKGPVISYPAFYKNIVIFAGGQGDGRVYFAHKKDCKLFYSYKTGYKVESDPVVEGDRVYVTSGDMHLYAFKINKTE
ncbi:MAG: hypothetical protein D6806_08270 [Deltaproteobacteria bacterium]|nr:MAG: hypothetical protein D6806_08270 [Deltaproteobacteria bacterium]